MLAERLGWFGIILCSQSFKGEGRLTTKGHRRPVAAAISSNQACLRPRPRWGIDYQGKLAGPIRTDPCVDALRMWRALADFDGLPSAPSTVRTYIILLRMDEIVRQAGAMWLRTLFWAAQARPLEVLLILILQSPKMQHEIDVVGNRGGHATGQAGERSKKAASMAPMPCTSRRTRRCRARAGHAIQAAGTQNL
jgi:hypothetical protein